MNKQMYYCKEIERWHYRELYGWFKSDEEAFVEFTRFLEMRKSLYQLSKWEVRRINIRCELAAQITSDLDNASKKLGEITVGKYKG